MKMPIKLISKHALINKAQSRTLVVVTAATIIIVFCLVSTKALLGQATYQRRVIDNERKAVSELQTYVSNANTLANQYNNVFEGSDPSNIIGGKNDKNPNATPPDGDNARIVLDALPSKYDFPALITSMAKILNGDKISNPVVTGSDASATASNNSTINPQPVTISLNVSGSSSYAGVQTLIKDLERSIRPFDVMNLQLNGSAASGMSISISLDTYYQPPRSLTVGSKEVH